MMGDNNLIDTAQFTFYHINFITVNLAMQW